MRTTKTKGKSESKKSPHKEILDNSVGPIAFDSESEVFLNSVGTTFNECIINLEEINGNRTLPIWIGISDGEAITIRDSDIVLPRPLTHDLLLSAINALGNHVEKIVISDFRENTFYARIQVAGKGGVSIILDSRPCDAIALAMRAGCPIYVEEKVFASAQTFPAHPTQNESAKPAKIYLTKTALVDALLNWI